MKKLGAFTVKLTRKQLSEISKNLRPFYGMRYAVVGQTRTEGMFAQDDIQFAVVDEAAFNGLQKVLSKMKSESTKEAA